MRFHVIAEHAPRRCEICHQADCFDTSTGKCTRCIDVSPMPAFAGGRNFEPRGVWRDVRWLIWSLVIGMSVWGGIYKQLSWTGVRETRDPELFAMTDFEGAVSPQPRILKSNDGVIRASNLFGGARPFLHEGGVSYAPTVRFFGKVVSYNSPTESEHGILLLEEGPGRILSVEISSFFLKDFHHHPLIEEAFQPGRFIRVDCVAQLGLFCGNTTRSEWIRARDRFEGWQPGSRYSPTLDSFESEALQPSEANDGNQAKKVDSPVPPAMPPRDRTGLYLIGSDRTGAFTNL